MSYICPICEASQAHILLYPSSGGYGCKHCGGAFSAPFRLQPPFLCATSGPRQGDVSKSRPPERNPEEHARVVELFQAYADGGEEAMRNRLKQYRENPLKP